jgi:hypothetical protein
MGCTTWVFGLAGFLFVVIGLAAGINQKKGHAPVP